MGILDEAIREHLDLKRHHGADESEIEGLEAEAFGPADRPDATGSESGAATPGSEAETQIISPGSSLAAPAGEGDQLDKVFDAGQAEAEADDEPSAEQHRIPPTPEAGDETVVGTPPEQALAAETAEAGPAAPEEAEPEAAAPVEPETVVGTPPEQALAAETAEAGPAAPEEAEPEAEAPAGDAGDDAGDALERERENLASHPTEHYDVDAAIAEEDEIDVLSESSLSDELDRALDGPSEPTDTSGPVPESEPAPSDADESAGPEQGTDEPEQDTESADEGEDVLEDTPDFLEETPEHDKLWFEQKEPKDFDFGD